MAALVVAAFFWQCSDEKRGEVTGPPPPVDDTLPPRVKAVYPADSVANVVPTTDIYIIFSKPIDPSSVTAGEFAAECGIPVAGQIRVSRDTVIFDPASELSTSVSTTVVFSGSITALDGTAAFINRSWTFRAGNFEIISQYPAAGEGCISSDAAIIVCFSRQLDQTTVLPANFVLTESDKDTIGGTVSGHDSIAVFQPNVRMTPLSTYKMAVLADVKDVYGYSLPGTSTWHFYIKGENLLPLAIGNMWVYRVTVDDHCSDKSRYFSFIDSVVIVCKTIVTGIEYYVDRDSLLYRNAGDTIIAFTPLPYNIAEAPWLINDDCSNNQIDSVETPAGIFICRKFVWSFPNMSPHSHVFQYAPGVGMIRHWYRLQCTGITAYIVTRELLSYELH